MPTKEKKRRRNPNPLKLPSALGIVESALETMAADQAILLAAAGLTPAEKMALASIIRGLLPSILGDRTRSARERGDKAEGAN